MNQCSLNAAEFSVAKAVRESVVEHINEWRRSRRADNVWMSLDPNWTEFQTPLRTWSAQKQCYEYLHIIAQDWEFDRNRTAAAVADKLICEVTGVADPWEKIDINTASP